jgi:hypothetical protein
MKTIRSPCGLGGLQDRRGWSLNNNTEVHMKRTIVLSLGGLILGSAQASFAAGLGIPLDGLTV